MGKSLSDPTRFGGLVGNPSIVLEIRVRLTCPNSEGFLDILQRTIQTSRRR